MSTTVTVAFSYTWVTNPRTGMSVVAPNAKRAGQSVLGGNFSAYAGGRIRLVATSADMRTTPVTLQALSDTDFATVEAWRGELVLLRDASGWRKWGSYIDVQHADLGFAPNGTLLHDVTFTLTEVYYAESV